MERIAGYDGLIDCVSLFDSGEVPFRKLLSLDGIESADNER